jgi:hypothetical protein
MKKRLIRTVVVAVWLVMMAWLVRHEAFPEYFTHAVPGYRGLIAGDVVLKDSWMKLLFKGQAIGYSHTGVETRDSDPARYYRITSGVRMKLRLMGEAQKIDVDTLVHLDVMQRLQSFEFELRSPGYHLKMKAMRAGERTFKLVTTTGTSRQVRTIEIPDDVVLHSPMTELAMRNLQPGQQMSIKTLDPTSMTTAKVIVRALRRESIEVSGQVHEATVLSSEYHGMKILSWVDADGEALRQETPFGWNMERCTINEAFEALRAAGRSDDVLKGMSVPCLGGLVAPKTKQELRLKLTGVTLDDEELVSNRQSVERRDGDSVEIVVKAAQLPAREERTASTDGFEEYLAASDTIQSDHVDIVRVARQIVGAESSAVARALAICDWVDEEVEDVMTVSLPSALDVLRTRKGDCNEHTYLFVALARAAGVPAVVKVGLAYYEGGFYYHAWPAVYVGDWVEMDPTWSQKTVDATHIALVEGELPSQVGLVKVMGQLKIEVLEAR